jgi:sulfide:quinone oxidoreductase
VRGVAASGVKRDPLLKDPDQYPVKDAVEKENRINPRPLASEISVSPQITAEDVRALANAGYRALICNRPDGEGPDQPNFKEIERAATECGLTAHYLPIESGKVTDTQAQDFETLLEVRR